MVSAVCVRCFYTFARAAVAGSPGSCEGLGRHRWGPCAVAPGFGVLVSYRRDPLRVPSFAWDLTVAYGVPPSRFMGATDPYTLLGRTGWWLNPARMSSTFAV